MQWWFGKNYNPYETDVKEGLHPVPRFLKKHNMKIRIVYYAPGYILSTLFIATIIHLLLKKIMNVYYRGKK